MAESPDRSLEHPRRCIDRFPLFATPNEADRLVEAYQAAGHMKRCAHVKVEDYRMGIAAGFAVTCQQESFIVTVAPPGPGPRWQFHGCPPDCRRYRPRWREQLHRVCLSVPWHLEHRIIGLGKWYASLSVPAQTIIAVGIAALLGSAWRNSVVEMLRIIFVK